MSSCPPQAHFWPATAASWKCPGRSRMGKPLATLYPLETPRQARSWEQRDEILRLHYSCPPPRPSPLPARPWPVRSPQWRPAPGSRSAGQGGPASLSPARQRGAAPLGLPQGHPDLGLRGTDRRRHPSHIIPPRPAGRHSPAARCHSSAPSSSARGGAAARSILGAVRELPPPHTWS